MEVKCVLFMIVFFTADAVPESYIILLSESRNNERTRTFLRILISFFEMMNRILKKKVCHSFIILIVVT